MSVHPKSSAAFACLDDAPTAHRPKETRELLRCVAAGDWGVFWEVWSLHRDYLFSICLRQMGGIRADAEDALSRAMIKAWGRLPEHAGKINNLKAWLARLTHNLCVDIQRERRRQTRGLENIEAITAADHVSLAHRIATPEEMVIGREMRLRLQRLIEDLPPNLSHPFKLHFLYGVSYADIAVRLDLSNDNVRKRIQHARMLLRRRLNERPRAEFHPAARRRREGSREGRDYHPPSGGEPGTAPFEVKSEAVAVRLVTVAWPLEREMSFEIFLDHLPGPNRVESLDTYVQTRSGGRKKHWERACLLYATGRWEEAACTLRSILERQPLLLDAYLLLGAILRATGQEAEARAIYESALRVPLRPASRHHVSGLMKVCQRRYDAAVEDFRQAAQYEPHNAAHWNGLGDVHLLAGSHTDALQVFDESLKVNPDDLIALTRSRGALLMAGRANEAEERAARALELDPDSVPALKWMADRSLLAGGREGGKKARRLLRAALRLSPEAAEAHESLAMQHIARGEWEKGLYVLRAFAERNPRSAAGWSRYARWLSRTGKQAAAAESALKAYELDPTGRETLELCCKLLAYERGVTHLPTLIEEMLAGFPDCWSVWAVAGRAIIEGLGDAERACAVSSRAVRLQPRLAAAWSQYGRVLVVAGKHREGVAALERAWKCPPDETSDDRVAAAIRLGESSRLLGDERRARAWFEEAAQKALALTALCPPLAHYRQGQALDALGDIVGAMQGYRAALDSQLLYPERQEAKRNLHFLRKHVPCGLER